MNHKLKISCSKENLKEIRRFVNEALAYTQLSELEINMLVLAVDEICANRIIHSNKCNESHFLELHIADSCDGVIFEILDMGEPYDHSTYKEPDIHQLVKEKKKGGVGLMLVNRIMDSFEVFREKEYNVTRLFKKVNLC
ncbi:MAG: ATP-binding protein [Cytophagaceae bacterium]